VSHVTSKSMYHMIEATKVNIASDMLYSMELHYDLKQWD